MSDDGERRRAFLSTAMTLRAFTIQEERSVNCLMRSRSHVIAPGSGWDMWGKRGPRTTGCKIASPLKCWAIDRAYPLLHGN